MFPETLNKALPQTVADVERMGLIGYGKKNINENIYKILFFV